MTGDGAAGDPSARSRRATGAIVLGGGRATRLGGADKAAVLVDGIPLVDHVYAAVAGCEPVLAIGPPTLARDGITVLREEPPLGGPAAGAVTGIRALPASVTEVWLLACDLPRARGLVAMLAGVPIPPGADGVIALDADGRRQWLAGRHRAEALRRAAEPLGDAAGRSMRALLGGLVLHEVPAGETTFDLDTWEAIAEHEGRRGR
ncbi:molybdenum cofactor guanylyltransferase [Brachybacterium sp. AOP25-B2-12]|uniref:molybdenum cofactor guanylyltransferase n=1 Tax=Brachybacterium sp. AOP25-B2-12 TaxID=3457710 RepID=UPI00403389C1